MRKKIVHVGRDDSYTAMFLKKNGLGITLSIDNVELGIQRFEELLDKTEKGENQLLVYSKDLI